MNLDNILAISIPEGPVKQIAINGSVIWEAKPAFDKYSWEGVFASIDAGTYATDYAIGDTVPLDLGSEGLINMQIAAFDTDDLADGTGKAPITWIAKEALTTARAMNNGMMSCYANWEDTSMRSYLSNTIMNLVSEIVRNRIVAVTKEHDAYNADGIFEGSTIDSVWLPSKVELSGMYNDLFPNAAARRKFVVGTTNNAYWWLRDAERNYYFHEVDSDSIFSSRQAWNKAAYIVIGFCT